MKLIPVGRIVIDPPEPTVTAEGFINDPGEVRTTVVWVPKRKGTHEGQD